MEEPEKNEHPVVEAWIQDELKKHGKKKFRALSPWVALAEEDAERATDIWNGVLDEGSFGCPVSGQVRKRTLGGKIKIELLGFSPGGSDIKGANLSGRKGSRAVAVVDDGITFIALHYGSPKEE